MMLKIFLSLYAGLEHAFEADHLIAVNTLVTQRDKVQAAIKDGIFWGIGHTFTIFVIGFLMLVVKLQIKENVFHYLEALVGVMLIILGIYRWVQWGKKKKAHLYTRHSHTHSVTLDAAFWVGTVHGLAGSGALVVVVMADSSTISEGLRYILLFGIGSIVGMGIASFLFSLPYTQKIVKSHQVSNILIIISSILCIGYGVKVIIENLI